MLLCAALSFARASHEAQPSAQAGRAFGAPLSYTLDVIGDNYVVTILFKIGIYIYSSH